MKQRKPLLAAIASLGALGLGQLYNGKLRKAIIMYGLGFVEVGIVTVFPPATSFFNLVILIGVAICIGVVVIVDAIRDARKLGEVELQRYNRWYVYLAILLFQGILLGPAMEYISGVGAMRAFKIPSGAMMPTIIIGDHLISNMKVYKTSKPKRGEIVVFKYPKDESTLFIKRVIGLPGEKVEVRGKQIFVDGVALIDPWGTYDSGENIKRQDHGPTVLESDEFFLMGDNRNNSYDSRYWGAVRQSKILGQARYIYWSRDKSRIGRQLN